MFVYGRDPLVPQAYHEAFQARRRPPSPARTIFGAVNWFIVAAFLAVLALCVYALIAQPEKWLKPATIIFVLVGWIFSLCVHEWAHAATAVLGGDNSPATMSYLSFNPLRYLHPVYSIILPVVFLLIGGIGLPGGAVYLRRDLVRSRGWQSAISAAGPLTNIVCVLLLAIPFNFGVVGRYPELAAALGALGFFEAIAILLNLLPIPGLDGFGIIAPWLSREAQAAVRPFYNYGVLILFFLLLTIQSLNQAFFTAVFHLLQFLHFDLISVLEGYFTLQFLSLGNRG